MEWPRKKEKINQALKKELLEMEKADQEMRNGPSFDPQIDKKNTARMKEILSQYGWPEKSLVGMSGSDAVWCLVQHADHDVAFQRHALALLEKAVEKREARKRHLAYLTDRVRVNSGEPQLYGTQFYGTGIDDLSPRPIEDSEHLDERRKEFGLKPFAEYKARLQASYRRFVKRHKKK